MKVSFFFSHLVVFALTTFAQIELTLCDLNILFHAVSKNPQYQMYSYTDTLGASVTQPHVKVDVSETI